MDKSHLAPTDNTGQHPPSHGLVSDSSLEFHPVRPPSSVFDMNRGGERRRKPSKLVLCFDGTGNKFRGDDSDSNILKIFRMLDRTASDQCKYIEGSWVLCSRTASLTTRHSTDHYYQRKHCQSYQKLHD